MPTDKKQKERSVEQHLLDRCRELDVFIVKNTGMNGIPDRLLIWQHEHWFLELKRPGKKPTDLQRAIAEKIRRHGGTALWADSRDAVDGILEALTSHRPPPKERYIL